MTVDPFGRPVGAMDPTALAIQVRGNDNILRDAVNGLPFQDPASTAGVTTSAVQIVAAITANGVALVGGDDGAGKAFVDLVVYNGAGSATAATGTTTSGSPAARTYTVSSGALKLAMASGTYTITVISAVFTT